MLKHNLAIFACIALPTLGFAQGTGSSGGSDGANLAKQLSNPIANLISVPLQYNFNEGYGDGSGQQSYVNIQPVIPFSVSPNWNVISRTIIPLVDQDDLSPASGSQRGIGNILQSFFFPRRPLQPEGSFGASDPSSSSQQPATTLRPTNGALGSLESP